MKRLALSLVCIILLFAQIPSKALATSSGNAISFEPTLTGSIDTTAREWFDGSKTRALLTVLLALDYQNANPYGTEVDIVSTSCVGLDEVTLYIVLASESGNKSIIISYTPALKMASYMIVDVKPTKSAMLDALREQCAKGAYANDLEDMLIVVKALSDAVN